MNTTPAATATFEGKTAAQWRAEAAESRQRSYDSFQRSDTDGFLSQAASDAMARQFELCADIAEDGGTRDFPAIFDLAGNLLAIAPRQGQYGQYWLNQGPAGNAAPRFIRPSGHSNKKTAATRDAAKGFRWGTVRVVPEVRMTRTWGSYAAMPEGTRFDEVTIVDTGAA